MIRRILNSDSLQYIAIFEALTGAKVKDCIIGHEIMFIVEKGNMGLALGRHGVNLKRAENAIKKHLRVIEFDDDVAQFIQNYSYPLRDFEVEKEGKTIKLKGKDMKTRSMLIGRDRSNLKKMLSIVGRFFEVDDIIIT